MRKWIWFAALSALVAGTALQATDLPDKWSLGMQGGLALPSGDDLRITTGSGVNLTAGVHATWIFTETSELRPRFDFAMLSRGQQDVATPLVQHLDTKVQGFSTGCDYLYRFDGQQGRWAAGAGLYLIRWSIDSTNRVSVPGSGVAQASGSSHWTREGLGLLGTYRVSHHLEAEARWISSHYGYENLPARFGTLGLLWRF